MRRGPAFAILPLVASLLVTPAFASSHIVAQKSSKRYAGSVYLRHSLLPGHSYQIHVAASGRRAFGGYAMQQLLGFYKGHMYSTSKPLKLQGRTPAAISVTQPVPGTLSSWIIVLQVQLKSGKGLTVKLIDLGTRH